MNGVLVIGRCGLDDVPLRLFARVKEAHDYAEGVTREAVLQAARSVYGDVVTVIICVALVEFRDGRPRRFTAAKDLVT